MVLAIAACSSNAGSTQAPPSIQTGDGSQPASTRSQGTFSPTGSMASIRHGQTATLLPDGRVLIAGGTYDGSAEVYDPKTGTFSPTGSMTTGRVYPTATLLPDGRVLIAGGGGQVSPVLASAEIYDPKTGTFSPTGSMALPRLGQTATLLSDGRVLIAGGTGQSGNIASAEVYDPKTGIFSPTGSMSAARWCHTASLLSDGRVLIAGGSVDAYGQSLASAELYDPKTGTFSPTGPMSAARENATASVLSDGRVLIAGGGNLLGRYPNLASAELYDPKTGTFSPTGSMTRARAGHTATVLSDGQVLAAGGIGGSAYSSSADYSSEYTATAELFDPETGVFTFVGSMTTHRSEHTATLLSDGRVLLAGGLGGGSGLQASADLYQP